MKRLIQVQKELKAPKNMINSFGNYKYRSAEGIIEAAKPLLHDNGLLLLLSDEIVLIGTYVFVKAKAFIYDAESSYQIASTTGFARHPIAKKGMDDSQLTGSTSSFARKYALNGIFAIDDAKDADSDEYGKLDIEDDTMIDWEESLKSAETIEDLAKRWEEVPIRYKYQLNKLKNELKKKMK